MELADCKKGLLVQLAGLGDLVMALPAIDALLEYYPEVQWTLLTRPSQEELLADRMADVVTMSWPPKATSILKQVSVIWQLRKRCFDLAVHLYSPASKKGELAIRALFEGIKPGFSAGRVKNRQAIFDINWDEKASAFRHETDLNLAFLSCLNISASPAVPVLEPPQASLVRMKYLIASYFPDGMPFATVFPGGARSTRHWPTENYIEVARYLRSLGMGVCVVGGHKEFADGERIHDGNEFVFNLAGKLGLLELEALLKQATIYIGNDSGPSHLAAAVGVPCVVIFGPGDSERCCPRGKNTVRMVRHAVDCAPCYLEYCSHHTCMQSLQFDAVKEKIDEIISGLK